MKRRSFLKTFCGAVAAAAMVVGAKLEVRKRWKSNPEWESAPYEQVLIQHNCLVAERQPEIEDSLINRRYRYEDGVFFEIPRLIEC